MSEVYHGARQQSLRSALRLDMLKAHRHLEAYEITVVIDAQGRSVDHIYRDNLSHAANLVDLVN